MNKKRPQVIIKSDSVTGAVYSIWAGSVLPKVIMWDVGPTEGSRYIVRDVHTNKLLGYSDHGTHINTSVEFEVYVPPILVDVVQTLKGDGYNE